jgi:hypothetical protein
MIIYSVDCINILTPAFNKPRLRKGHLSRLGYVGTLVTMLFSDDVVNLERCGMEPRWQLAVFTGTGCTVPNIADCSRAHAASSANARNERRALDCMTANRLLT